MKEAFEEAKIAFSEGEVPIGAVVVKDGKIVGRGHNKREYGKNALYHAEILAINEACKNLNGWRLFDCDMYVTLEPCPMCAGAIINSRIKNLYFSAYDKRFGACGSVINLFEYPFNHIPKVSSGIMEDDSVNLLKKFFKELRNKN